jgi:hypothetical protein
MSDIADDCVLELRTRARLIETNAPIVWREQDAAQLREAADEIERLRKALSGLVRYLEFSFSLRLSMPVKGFCMFNPLSSLE